MPDPEQLPALLRLVDDDSDVVRVAVLNELASFGPELERELRALADPPDDVLIARILIDLSEHAQTRQRGPDPGTDGPFEPGQLVAHRRYGYRGVVVGCDDRCLAPEDWYLSNNTQPERDQPWYHVLVHDSSQVTYAANSSLAPDESGTEVRHPLVPLFFNGIENGRYKRNDRDWPPPPT